MLGAVCSGIYSPAQSAPTTRSTGPITPIVSKAKQQAEKRVAITKAGYYKNLFLTNHYTRLLAKGRSRAAFGNPCTLPCTQTVMPVKLIRFSGERLDETQVKLTWETSEEVNNDYFGIQRSLNPANGFETIASVKGVGSSSRSITYQAIDPNTYADYTYYRLKQVDLDGTYTFSQIIAVKGGLPLLSVKAFPNPSQQKDVTFQVAGIQATELLSVVLYDSQGRLIYQNESFLLASDRRLAVPALSGLLPGSYYLHINTKNQQASTSFIILH